MDGLQDCKRVEAFSRKDHRRTVRRATEHTHTHAETVIERHGNAQAVAFRKLLASRHEVTVVDDVVMRERRAFRQARRAARELDVDGIFGL